MKIKLIWIFIALMWLSLIAGLIVREFSKTAYWILYGCWAVFCIASLICASFTWRELKKEEKRLDRELEEDRKRLEDLIKGYLIARKVETDKYTMNMSIYKDVDNLPNIENKEDKEG